MVFITTTTTTTAATAAATTKSKQNTKPSCGELTIWICILEIQLGLSFLRDDIVYIFLIRMCLCVSDWVFFPQQYWEVKGWRGLPLPNCFIPSVGLCDTQGWISSSLWRTQDSAWILECPRSPEVSVMHRRLNLRNSLLGPLSNVGGIGHFKSLESEKELENLEAFLVFIILPEEFSRTLKWTVPSSYPVLTPDPSVHLWPQTQPLLQPDWCVSHVYSPSHGALWALAFPSSRISSLFMLELQRPLKGFCLN